MIIKDVLVNWALFDEEIFEPYEWDQDDDLEILKEVEVFLVDLDTMNDIYNNFVKFDICYKNSIFIFASENGILCIETDQNAQLRYRSVLLYSLREEIYNNLSEVRKSDLKYNVYDYCDIKEFGITRKEREKKQILLNTIYSLCKVKSNYLQILCKEIFLEEISTLQVYDYFYTKLFYGYRQIHNYLYLKLQVV